MARRCCLRHLVKQNHYLSIFLKNLILRAQVPLPPVFPSRPKLKLRKIVKKVIMNLDLSKASSLLVDHLEKCSLFSDFEYGFRSCRSTADLWTVVSSDSIARAFNRSGAR